jgi:hypothetical protein
MRSFKWAVAALALSGLTGCMNSDPELYRVALAAPPSTLAATCYRNNTVPTTIPDQQTNTVSEEDWVLWDGVDDTKYLDVGDGRVSADMADAADVNIGVDAIEGKSADGKLVFVVERTVRDTNSTVVTAATYTFDEVGQTAEGTVSFRSATTCTSTTGCTPISCEFSRRFVGRRVDGDRFINAGSSTNN